MSCADGRLHREYTTKIGNSSPTVLLEETMLSCAINTKEGSYAVVTDIPGAFLHADMDQHFHMLLESNSRVNWPKL